MAKQPLNIQEFHGGLNSDSDPRDLRPSESPSLQDVAIDSVGRIKVLGSSDTGTPDSNAITILKNRGLFTMSSDRKLDGSSSNETLIFCFDNSSNTVDIKDSDGWSTAQISMGGATIPIYYNADGVVRVSDASLTQGSQWFGYIQDQRLASLNATGPAAGWANVAQALETPTAGTCLVSTPIAGTDSHGIFSSASEYIGNVIDDGTSADQVVDHSAVNLRVGIQLNEILATGSAAYSSLIACSKADSSDIHPCFGGLSVTKFTGSSSSNDYSTFGAGSLNFDFSENESVLFSIFFTTAEYNSLTNIKVIVDDGASGTNPNWKFGKEQIKPNMWNILVCCTDNISGGSENFPINGSTAITVFVHDTKSSGGAAEKIDFYTSGISIAEFQPTNAYTPGVYTFHHTYLYDVENKQESLPFVFNGVDSGSEPDNVNSINVAGSSILFNFDSYICSNVAAGDAYGLNKRISGSRLYYKVEENDNYFLIGELDFIKKGFKWLPESDINSYPITNTTSTSAPILSKTAIVKGISPESANIVDTYKSINGFSSEVKSLNAKYKTAVVQGRRTYIGNILQDGKTHPDRILKSQVNRFDTFPEEMGTVDVAIRDGENIVKLEAFADRILQFKENSLYIINVSENIDFLEDTYRNRGCAFDYHVTKTDIGIAWFNVHGVYLYNGKEVSDLLIKEGIRVISESDWEAFITDATDDPDTSSAMIGYIPKKKQILIKNENNDVYIYDFVLRAWTTGKSRLVEATAMTNFALDANQNLFYIDGTTTVRKTWLPSPVATTNFIYKTPDIDFGQPSVRKKVYRVRISYKGDADNLVIKYSINGDTDSPYDFEGTDLSTGKPSGSTATSSKPLHDKTDLTVWHHGELKPDVSSEANNIYSFQLHMSGTVDSDFEINDISIIYRMKSVK